MAVQRAIPQFAGEGPDRTLKTEPVNGANWAPSNAITQAAMGLSLEEWVDTTFRATIRNDFVGIKTLKRMNRRAFLLATGITALAGCQGIGGEPQTVRLGKVEVANRLEREQSITVTVRAEGVRSYHEKLDLPPRNDDFRSKRIDGEFRSQAPRFTFEVEAEGIDGITGIYDEPHENGCYNLIILVTRGAEIDILEGTKGTCPGESHHRGVLERTGEDRSSKRGP